VFVFVFLAGGVSDSPTRLQLQLLKEGEGGPALTLEQAVAALRPTDPEGSQLLKVRRNCLQGGECVQGVPALTLEQSKWQHFGAAASPVACEPERHVSGGCSVQVLENRELQGPGSDRSTRHVQLQLPEGPAGEYSSGEHLEVYGNNDGTLVETALALLGLGGRSTEHAQGGGARVRCRSHEGTPVVRGC
jgi:hypothetical protein